MKVLLVDDEPVARQRMRRLLAAISDIEILGEVGSSKEALAFIAVNPPDLVLLDIEMPGVDGLALASLLDAAIIFVTAHSDRALAAFDVGAHDYLVKPVQKERLEAALERVRTRVREAKESSQDKDDVAAMRWRLTVTDGSVKRFADAREVDCFSASEKYVSFVVAGRELLLRDSLDALEERLAGYGFVRANRAALVRVEAAVAFDGRDGGTLVLHSGERIPVSRRSLAVVRRALGIKKSP